MPRHPGDRVVSVEKLDFEFRGYHITGTSTQLANPDRAKEAREIIIADLLPRLPLILAEMRAQREAATPIAR